MEKLILFAATEKGYSVCSRILDKLPGTLGYVVTFSEVNVSTDWSRKIIELCRSHNVASSTWNEIKGQLYDIISVNGITCALAVSWKYYISLDINKYLTTDLIVFHDSLLPKYRGFAPTPTAIINGDDTIGITALFASGSIDCGEVIIQKELPISQDMYMSEIIKMESEIYGEMALEIIDLISHNCISSKAQDEEQATYSIWRDLTDCEIDWRRDADQIYNLIRAVSKPYLGAYTFLNGEKIIIDKAHTLSYDLDFAIRDCGKFWKIEEGCPTVVCGNGLLQIEEARYENGNKVTFSRLRTRLGSK